MRRSNPSLICKKARCGPEKLVEAEIFLLKVSIDSARLRFNFAGVDLFCLSTRTVVRLIMGQKPFVGSTSKLIVVEDVCFEVRRTSAVVNFGSTGVTTYILG